MIFFFEHIEYLDYGVASRLLYNLALEFPECNIGLLVTDKPTERMFWESRTRNLGYTSGVRMLWYPLQKISAEQTESRKKTEFQIMFCIVKIVWFSHNTP